MLLWHIDFELEATEKQQIQEELSVLPLSAYKQGRSFPFLKKISMRKGAPSLIPKKGEGLIT